VHFYFVILYFSLVFHCLSFSERRLRLDGSGATHPCCTYSCHEQIWSNTLMMKQKKARLIPQRLKYLCGGSCVVLRFPTSCGGVGIALQVVGLRMNWFRTWEQGSMMR